MRIARVLSRAAAAFAFLLFTASPAHALTNGLALTPPMGWNDWNNFHCGINETIVRQTADAMATNGMKAAGYLYVNVDDGWAGSRDSNGMITAFSGDFPGGIKALADYVHGKGLKLGIYTDHGTNTCSSCVGGVKSPGSFGYEYIDAMTYASWGVDYLKNDSCNQAIGGVAKDNYFRMMDGLMKSGRPIVVSICQNREHYEYWTPAQGNLWRTTGDIGDTFSSMVGKIDPNSKSAYVAGPGRWNDPDMLEIGNGGMTDTEYRAHFTMWCIVAAPLISGADLRTISAASLAIMTNPEAIAVNQDPAGEQGIRVAGTAGATEVWSKPLGYDFTTCAVALFNRTTNAANITCYWTNLALQTGTATVRDLWTHADLGSFTDSFTTNVPAHATVLLKIVGAPLPLPPLGTNYASDLQPIWAYTGFGTLTKDKSIDGNTLTLGGVPYSKGIGTHAIGGQEYNLGGIASRFQSDIGVDDEVGSSGSVIFQVFADGMKIYDSGIMTGSTATKVVDLDVTGVRRLTIGVTDTGNDVVPGSGSRINSCHADWAGARIIVTNTTPRPPATPAGLATAAGNPIALSWAATRSATAYQLQRSTVNGGPYTNLAILAATTFNDSNVVVGTTYYYVLSATNSIGASAASAQVSGTACSPPATPSGVGAASGAGQIAVRWNTAAGATGYTLARFTRVTPPTIIASGLANTNYVDTNVITGTTYFYLVAATNGCTQSAFSAFAAGTSVGPPAAPTGLSAGAGNSSVVLVWTAVTSAESYKIKRSTTNGGPYLTVASNVVATSYVDGGLSNGVTYYYVVSAVNGAGESVNSAPASATPDQTFVTGMVVRLTFDDGTGSDSSGHNNHGLLLNGAAVVDDVDRGKVVALDGVNDYVDLGTNSSLDLSDNGQATIAAWVRMGASQNHNSILTKGEWRDAYSLLIKGDVGDVLWTGNDTSVFSSGSIPANTWTHVAVTINGNLTTFYINGQLSGATNQNRGNPIDNNPLDHTEIGREDRSDDGTLARWYFNGRMDDVRLYELSLTQTEIQSIMAGVVNLAPSFTADPFSKPAATAGQPFAGSIAGDATDPNAGDALTFSRVSGPAWLDIAANGGLSGTPLSGDAGTNSFVVRVTDAGSLFDEATLNVTVAPAPPIFSSLSWAGSNLLLNWTGGIPPYQVHTKTNLANVPWENYGAPVATNGIIINPSNPAEFFRIQGQ